MPYLLATYSFIGNKYPFRFFLVFSWVRDCFCISKCPYRVSQEIVMCITVKHLRKSRTAGQKTMLQVVLHQSWEGLRNVLWFELVKLINNTNVCLGRGFNECWKSRNGSGAVKHFYACIKYIFTVSKLETRLNPCLHYSTLLRFFRIECLKRCY